MYLWLIADVVEDWVCVFKFTLCVFSLTYHVSASIATIT